MSVIKVRAKQLVVLSVPPTVIDYSESDEESYDVSTSSPILSPVSNRYSSTFRRSISTSSISSNEDYSLRSSTLSSPPSSPSSKDYQAAKTPFHRRSIGKDMPPCPPIPQKYL